MSLQKREAYCFYPFFDNQEQKGYILQDKFFEGADDVQKNA
jgi:hypothetical protein